MGMCRLLGIDIYEVLRFISFIIFHFHSMKVYFTFKTIFDHLLIVNTPWISEFESQGKGEGGEDCQSQE